MARKGKKGAGGVWAILALFVVGAIASVPQEFWVVAGIGLVGYLGYRYSRNTSSTKTAQPVKPSSGTASRTSRPPSPASEVPAPYAPAQALQFAEPAATDSAPAHVPGRPLRFSEVEEPVQVPQVDTPRERGFKLPAAPKAFQSTRWVPPGEMVEVAGYLLPGGMLYVGPKLKAPSGQNDPCLIDPKLPISKNGDYQDREMGYWPSYSGISSTARRAYLRWLSGGRQDPQADVGFVFLYFYGLERRVILDSATDPAAKEDWPEIAKEIRRLLSIYGGRSGSFRRYANELLEWVALPEYFKMDLEREVPDFTRTYELPLLIRLALGKAAVENIPVPARLALSWARLEPAISLRTPATRCIEQFDALFMQRYAQKHGEGMSLPRNRTKLKKVYRPASAGFHGRGETLLTFGDTPDVSILAGPQRTLQALVDEVTKELEPYSRYLGKSGNSKTALEGLLQLPATLWPDQAQAALQRLKARMGEGMVSMPFQELLASLGAQGTLTKDRTLALARALESMNMGIEPDVLGGAKTPKPEEPIVLFYVPPGEASSRTTPAYQAAMLTLQLASSVASADGEFSVKEMSHLREQTQAWTHLTPNHLRRLLAHLRLLMAAPVPLAALKKKLEPLDTSAKETIATFMATVAQADGTVTPAEVKMLEKVYKVLGVEPKKVFSDVHAAAAGVGPGASPKAATDGFKLDPARIAELQKDTAKVSALLANIFKEDEVPAPPALAPEVDVEAEVDDAGSTLLGLDEPHTALARMVLSRPQWSREELLDVAADLDLMLDGALERINEAAFDIHDIPFTEGEDPVEVNAEMLEKLEA